MGDWEEGERVGEVGVEARWLGVSRVRKGGLGWVVGWRTGFVVSCMHACHSQLLVLRSS